jgi:hypothetical protein
MHTNWRDLIAIHIFRDGRQYGPYEETKIKHSILLYGGYGGQLCEFRYDDWAWREGTPLQWRPLKEVLDEYDVEQRLAWEQRDLERVTKARVLPILQGSALSACSRDQERIPMINAAEAI